MNAQSYNGTKLIDKSWYYVYDEPQNPTEYNLAALNCWFAKKAIPNLRVGVCRLCRIECSLDLFFSLFHANSQVSEEAKKDIAELSDCGCGFDIWISSAHAYRHGYAQFRAKKYGEVSWIYSLIGDGGSSRPRAGTKEILTGWIGGLIRLLLTRSCSCRW